ncbi:MAG: peptide chain release factor 1 [Candidatus Diapherotrites archaeon]|uniref:Peptide chain release factor subunit 1 n=1 Tax=Candidatus Iainarchaeum sp. TaxID=3101447 RepID=A0A938YPJ9_9ARCH|nr:peptide chain release factor 1 [Candidatus Diapherotrites archaeon]
MAKEHLEEISEADMVVFKKKLRKFSQFRGKGTELISLYLPPDVDRGTVMSQLTEETSQSSNIKSPTTRKNVQGALRKIQNFLKTIDFKLPKNGLVVFCGNVSEKEGKSDIQLFTLKPVKTLKTKLYWCDSEFHLAPLEEMAQPSDFFGILAIDKNEATIALLIGKKYEILGHFTSGVSGKSRAGGQSAHRFERLREEAANDFFKRIAEKMNNIFLPYGEKLKGLLIAGPGITKNYFLNKELLDHRLQKIVLGTVDTSYTDESGIREAVNDSGELLHDAEITKEKAVVNQFLTAVVKTGLAAYGQKEVEEALKLGKVSLLLLSENNDWSVYKFRCNSCNFEEELVVKEPGFDENRYKCPKCQSSQAELLEQVDYIDWMVEKAKDTGAETKLVSSETAEGEQFSKGFGGIGAILRYK